MRRGQLGRAAAIFLVAGLVSIGCGSSFVPPTEALVAEFKKQHPDVEVAMTAAGSEDFLPHVQMKDQGSILVTHDPYLAETEKAGALTDSAQVGFVAPVLAVQPGNPKGLTSIDDLTKPGLKVALSDPQYSTCGQMVERLLKKKGLYDAVMQNVENRVTKGHAELGTFLKTKTVDAVIMWNGVAHTFKDSLQVVKTPYEYDEETRVSVIGLNYAPNQDLVRAFVDLAKKDGQRIFSEYGYVK
jgi:molybdate transport system substrate-binding protein